MSIKRKKFMKKSIYAVPISKVVRGLDEGGTGDARAVEVILKPQIAFESKAQADGKAQHTLKYVSILKRSATPLSDARWGFGNTSK
jgi:hypothetical protein